MANNRRDFLIIGLGNPGDEYALTRHNVGFIVVDELAGYWRSGCFREKWQASATSTIIDGRKIHIVKPHTYMNRSGMAVRQFYHFYKIKPDQLLVVHDDLDMNPGRVKLVRGGGAGGHNGVKSIAELLGNNQFLRLKIGIGRPGKGDIHKDFPVDKYVLSHFSPDDLEVITDRYRFIEEGVRMILSGNVSKAMTLLNGLK